MTPAERGAPTDGAGEAPRQRPEGSDLTDELLALERGFWLEGAPYYRRHLGADAVMVLPAPAGVLEREATLAAIEQASRWKSVDFADVRSLELSRDAAALTYQARAWREDGTRYDALATSVYRQSGGRWQLVVHQQTPLPSG